MRRRRQVLQVTTFPFLAVLLCAMGSLILLLLVLDRRAKIVAAWKATRAAQSVPEEDKTAEDAMRAEAEQRAERKRLWQALHDTLSSEKGELAKRLAALGERQSAVAQAARREAEHAEELRRRLAVARAQLAQEEQGLSASRFEADRAQQLGAAAREEATRLTARLQELEQALADLKAARQRDVQTYSLIPYKGRRGDNRRPLYLEFTARGAVFHPDRLALEGSDFTAETLRKEIDRRLARQRTAGSAAGEKPCPDAYLMMLVRPDGIISYYQAMAALRGLEIDFGYEFIDPDWILDFPEDDTAPGRQPWMTAERTAAAPPLPPRALPPLSPRDKGDKIAGRGAVPPEVDGAMPGRGTPLSPATPRLGKPGVSASPPLPWEKHSSASGSSGNAGYGTGQHEDPPQAGVPEIAVGAVPGSSAPPRPIAPPTRLVGNRDWIIALECRADGVLLRSTGQKFSIAALSADSQGKNSLLEAIRQMIARRQASVRPGEPPYRPHVRFLVYPDGLRTYFLAYPSLEPLQVPLTRQDVEPADERP